LKPAFTPFFWSLGPKRLTTDPRCRSVVLSTYKMAAFTCIFVPIVVICAFHVHFKGARGAKA
jgi:hypothetical protein